MKTAILGGSFNPVHMGHVLLAGEVHALGYERVFFIPSSTPPHKGRIEGATEEQRIRMLNLAIGTFPWARIWDGEIRRGGTSYTIDTIRELKTEGLIGSRPALVIGDDLAGGFGKWKEVDALVDEVDIILARRIPVSDLQFPYPCIRLENFIWPYSSTEVRMRIKAGRGIEEILPPEVAEYIVVKGLYGYQKT